MKNLRNEILRRIKKLEKAIRSYTKKDDDYHYYLGKIKSYEEMLDLLDFGE